MSEERWIVIPNWDRFQHYKDRDPSWIKVYLELFNRDDYLRLTPTSRALLHGIWGLYALSHGRLRASRVPQALNMRASSVQWESLVQAGFIELSASESVPLTRSRENFVLKKEEEDARALAPEPAEAAPAAPALEEGETVCPRCGLDRKNEQSLRDHLANVHGEYDVATVAPPAVVPDDFAEHVRGLIRGIE